MSEVLLVKLEGSDRLYRANTQERDAGGSPVVRFKAWVDYDGIDLYWMGRPVAMVYTTGGSAEVWYRVSVPDAAKSLLDRGACARVSSEPSPEERLPA